LPECFVTCLSRGSLCVCVCVLVLVVNVVGLRHLPRDGS
jgi:hypothetical protein